MSGLKAGFGASAAEYFIELCPEVFREGAMFSLQIAIISLPVIEQLKAVEAFLSCVKLVLSILPALHLVWPCCLVAEID